MRSRSTSLHLWPWRIGRWRTSSSPVSSQGHRGRNKHIITWHACLRKPCHLLTGFMKWDITGNQRRGMPTWMQGPTGAYRQADGLSCSPRSLALRNGTELREDRDSNASHPAGSGAGRKFLLDLLFLHAVLCPGTLSGLDSQDFFI